MTSSLKTCQLKELASFEMGQSPNSDFVNESENGLPFLQGCAEFGSQVPNHSFYCSQPKKIAQKGDVLVSVRAPVGTLNKADQAYCIGRGLAAVRFNESTLASLGWHLLSYWAEKLQRVAQGSTFQAIGKSELENLKVLAIPKHEQQKIAHILDTIDNLITLTNRHIAKLKLAKAGLLHDLLTRGIDENGELRDPIAHPEQFKETGTEIGRIPKGWGFSKISDFYAIPARNGLYKQAQYYGRGNLMIHMPQMFRGLQDTSDAVRVEVVSSELERFGLCQGDLVFARRSLNLEGAGRCSLVPQLPEPATFESSIIRVRLSTDKLIPEFVNYFLNSEIGTRLRLPLIRQAAVSGVSSEDIASLPIPKPEITEQTEIINRIESANSGSRSV